jgi:hypothetical protein
MSQPMQQSGGVSQSKINVEQIKQDPQFLFGCVRQLIVDTNLIDKDGDGYTIDTDVLAGWDDDKASTFKTQDEAVMAVLSHYYQNKNQFLKSA